MHLPVACTTEAVCRPSPRLDRSRPALAALAFVGAVAAGVALGFATQVLQGWLHSSWAVLANSGVMWALAAFAVGLVMPSSRTAAVGGAVALVAAAFAYYVAVDWFEGVSSGPRSAVVWSIAGAIAGSTFGFAGFVARRSRQHRTSAWAVVSGVLTGEGIHLIYSVGNPELPPAGITELALAALIATACVVRTKSSSKIVSATTVGAVGAAAALATLLASRLINGAFASL